MARQKIETTYSILVILNLLIAVFLLISLPAIQQFVLAREQIDRERLSAGFQMMRGVQVYTLVVCLIALFGRYSRLRISRVLFLASNIAMFLIVPIGTIAACIGLTRIGKQLHVENTSD